MILKIIIIILTKYENNNLFNVALSRARAAFIVVGDREAVENVEHNGKPIRYLKDFVSYVRKIESPEPTPDVPDGDIQFSPEQIWEEN